MLINYCFDWHTHTRTHTCMNARTYTRTHKHKHTHAHRHRYKYTHKRTYTRTRTHARKNTHTHARTNIHIHVYVSFFQTLYRISPMNMNLPHQRLYLSANFNFVLRIYWHLFWRYKNQFDVELGSWELFNFEIASYKI